MPRFGPVYPWASIYKCFHQTGVILAVCREAGFVPCLVCLSRLGATLTAIFQIWNTQNALLPHLEFLFVCLFVLNPWIHGDTYLVHELCQ